MSIRAHFDGCCEPRNPGGAMGIGAVVLYNQEPIFEHSVYVPEARTNSNNVAEYRGFIAICKFLLAMDHKSYPTQRIDIRGDSKLVVCQMNGQWRIKFGHYVSYAREAEKLWEKVRLAMSQHDIIITLQWTPRAQNDVADVLSKKGMIEAGVEFKIQPI